MSLVLKHFVTAFLLIHSFLVSAPRCPDPLADLNSDVLVSGGKSRNRAVHGDIVAVELLQRSEWRGRVTALSEGQGEDKLPESTQSQPMPTGEGKIILGRSTSLLGDREHPFCLLMTHT